MKDYIRQNKTCRRRLRSIIWHFIDQAINRIINKIMSTYWNDRCRLVKLNKNDGLNWFLSFDFESHLMCSPRFVFLGVSTSVSELVTQHWQNRQRSAHIFPFVPLLLLRLAWVCVCVCARVLLSVCAFKRTLTHIRLVSSMTSNLSERRRWSYETGCCIFSL